MQVVRGIMAYIMLQWEPNAALRGAKEKENSEWVRHCLRFNDKNVGTGRSGLVWFAHPRS
jgi:hypothetical protein